jgi:hypothetical protein
MATKTMLKEKRGVRTLKEQLAEAFDRTQAFKWDPKGGFKLASGLTSPFYVDCRTLMAHPAARRLVAELAYKPSEISKSTAWGIGNRGHLDRDQYF